MRRIWITLLAAAIVTAMAVPVGAAVDCTNEKFANHPQCQDPPTAVKSIDVHIDAEPVWVHERDDLIRYRVTMENKTGEDISDVAVQFTTTATGHDYANPTDKWEYPDDSVPGLVPANSSVWLKFYLYVHQFPEAEDCGYGDECPLPAAVEVLVDGTVVTQTEMSMALMPYPPCGFTYDVTYTPEGVIYTSEPVLMEGFGVCIWTLPHDDEGNTKTGIWEITLDPVPPKNLNQPIWVQATVRDGVPGNWCSLAVGTPSAIKERWKVGDDPIVGRAYLRGVENIDSLELADGMCLNGGAGGEYFAVGNPKSFYLATTEATVTVRWVRALP